MKKTIFMLVILAFFSCSTDDEQTIQETKTVFGKSQNNATDYNDERWGTVNAFYYNNREVVKIWMQYGQYKAVKRNEVDRIVFYKIPGRAVYYADPNPIVDPTKPEEGVPGILIKCDDEDDLINSTDWWALALIDGGPITVDQAAGYEQQQQQEIANATGQAIFFKVCYDGLFIKSELLLPDGSVIGSPDGVVTEPGTLSGTWNPE